MDNEIGLNAAAQNWLHAVKGLNDASRKLQDAQTEHAKAEALLTNAEEALKKLRMESAATARDIHAPLNILVDLAGDATPAVLALVSVSSDGKIRLDRNPITAVPVQKIERSAIKSATTETKQ